MLNQIKITKFMNFQMDKQLQFQVKDSDVLKLYSSQWSSANKCQVSIKLHINQFLNVMLILEKTYIATLLCLVEQLCIQVFLKDLVNK
jgi:hypothetical protein